MISTTPCKQTQAQAATETARVAPPASSTWLHSQQSNLPPPSRHPGLAVAVMRQQRHQHGMVRISRRITCLENKVHQALAVMDTDTGKLLNYRQLMQSTKHKKAWSLSPANKFGHLANDIGNRGKNPTNTIEFICQHKVPKEQKQDLRMGNSCAQYNPKRLNPIEHVSLLEETGSTTLAKLPLPLRKC